MPQERNTQAIKLAVHHYWQQMEHDWRLVLPGLLLPGIGSTLTIYVPPLIIAKILKNFRTTNDIGGHQLLPYVLGFTGAWLLGEALWRVGEQLVSKAEASGMQNLFINAMDHLFVKDITFFKNNFAGSLTKKVVGYGQNYTRLLDTVLYNVTSNLLPLVLVTIVLWRFSPWLVVALLGMMTVIGLIVLPLIRHRQKLVTLREAASNHLAGNIADAISNIEAIKGFAHESSEAYVHSLNTRDYVVKSKRTWDYQNLRINTIISPLYIITNVLGLVVALTLSRSGSIRLEVIFITFSYYAQFTRFIWNFNGIYRNLETSITEAAQFTELLLENPLLSDPDKPEPLRTQGGNVEFKDVTFRYHDSGGNHLFRDLNLKIASGQKIGLVGRSGGGKTTITKLLLRFMDIDSGEILIDGQNIALITQADLRSAITYVPQEPLLFHRSLADNIRYGQLDASDEQVREAARLAHAADFIEKLPHDYDTLVGERGIKLSGGQRQRVAIARAMLKKAPIVVLDEATSSLDSESEKLIQDALWKLMQGRTAIVIAHRLSTVQKMDRIIVLDEGKILEEGSHHELLAKKGKYAELWAHQSGGFLEE